MNERFCSNCNRPIGRSPHTANNGKVFCDTACQALFETAGGSQGEIPIRAVVHTQKQFQLGDE